MGMLNTQRFTKQCIVLLQSVALIGLILPAVVEGHCTEACVFGSYTGRELIPCKMKCDFQWFEMFAAAACGGL